MTQKMHPPNAPETEAAVDAADLLARLRVPLIAIGVAMLTTLGLARMTLAHHLEPQRDAVPCVQYFEP